MGIPIPVYRDDDDAAVTLRGQVGQEPCRFGRYTRRLERNPFRRAQPFSHSCAASLLCIFRAQADACVRPEQRQPGLTLFCRFGRRIDDLLPDFLGLEHVTPNELGAVDGLYLALRGWPTPGRATEPRNLRRANGSAAAGAEAAHADARAARGGAEARRDGSVASMPELLVSSDEDEDEDGGSADAPAAAVAAALEAADAPWLRMPGNARARQRQARGPRSNN